MTTLALDDTEIMAIIAEPEMRWWSRLHDLKDLADHHRELTRRLAILEGQLEEEGRGTAHGRDKATVRAAEWRKRLLMLDDESHTLRLILAASWHKLPRGERSKIAQRLQVQGGMSAPRIALALWERAKAGETIPGMAPW